MEIPNLEEFLNNIKKTWEEAKISIERTKETIKKQYDRKRKQSQELKKREQVWLEAKNIQSTRFSKKLDQKRYGPFTIIKEIGQEAYRLELLEG